MVTNHTNEAFSPLFIVCYFLFASTFFLFDLNQCFIYNFYVKMIPWPWWFISSLLIVWVPHVISISLYLSCFCLFVVVLLQMIAGVVAVSSNCTAEVVIAELWDREMKLLSLLRLSIPSFQFLSLSITACSCFFVLFLFGRSFWHRK